MWFETFGSYYIVFDLAVGQLSNIANFLLVGFQGEKSNFHFTQIKIKTKNTRKYNDN